MTLAVVLCTLCALCALGAAAVETADFDPTPPGIRVMDELRAKGIYTDEELSYLEGLPSARDDEDQTKLGLYGREVDGRKRASLYTNTMESEVHVLVNQERAKVGAKPLYAHSLLISSARKHSNDMLSRNFFSHNTPEGVSPFTRMADEGYPAGSAENIAWGQRSPAEVMNSWMNSPGHRTNILSTGSIELGVGLSSRNFYWTQTFGRGLRGCGNGFRDSGESCDTGDATEANCVNCQVVNGATCTPRQPLEGGDSCGSAQVTKPPPTPAITTTKAATTTTTTTRTMRTLSPGETTLPGLDLTPRVETLAPKPPTSMTNANDLLACTYAAGRGCESCINAMNGGVCKWCPVPGKKACMPWLDMCGSPEMSRSIRTVAECKAAISSAQAGTEALKDCASLTVLGCGGCVASNCQWCPATEQCMEVTGFCKGSLSSKEACDEANNANDKLLMDLEVIDDPSLMTSVASGMPPWLIAVIAVLGCIVLSLIVGVGVMAALAQKEKKEAEMLRKWAEETGTIAAAPAPAAPSSSPSPMTLTPVSGVTIIGPPSTSPLLYLSLPGEGISQINDDNGYISAIHAPLAGNTIKKTLPLPPLTTPSAAPAMPMYVNDVPDIHALNPVAALIAPPNSSIAMLQQSNSAREAPSLVAAMKARAVPLPPPPQRETPAAPSGLGFAIALFDFQGTEPTDLSLKAGDRIALHDVSLSWWKGEVNGVVGNFPSNYAQRE